MRDAGCFGNLDKGRRREQGEGRERQAQTRGAKSRTQAMAKLPAGGRHVAMGLLFGTAYGIALSTLWRSKYTASDTGVKASNCCCCML